MTIRFYCASCGQPIEIDEEWALRRVACPYCRNTVTAPRESDPALAQPVAVASPLDDYVGRAVSGRNPLGVAALVLAGATLVQFVAVGLILYPHRTEIAALHQRVTELQSEGKGTFAAMQQVSSEFHERHGGRPPGWMVAGWLLQVSGGLTWMATLVCALFGVRRRQGRGLAITAFVIAAMVPVVFCCVGL